jgi:hypothetical protein
MFGSLPALIVFRKLNRCLPSPLTSVNSVPRAIPFRITSFAHPHRLTLIESHLCKKQGVPPLATRHFRFFRHAETPASHFLSWTYLTFLVTPGGHLLQAKNLSSQFAALALFTFPEPSNPQVFQPSNAHAIPRHSPPLLCLLAPFLLSSAPKRENSNVR